MGRSARPRKPYNPNAHRARVLVSMGMTPETHDALALQLHTAVETLIAAPGLDAYNRMTKMVARTENALGRTTACLEVAKEVLISVADRFSRTGKVGLSTDEATQLKTASSDIDKLMARIPDIVMLQSQAKTEILCDALAA